MTEMDTSGGRDVQVRAVIGPVGSRNESGKSNSRTIKMPGEKVAAISISRVRQPGGILRRFTVREEGAYSCEAPKWITYWGPTL